MHGNPVAGGRAPFAIRELAGIAIVTAGLTIVSGMIVFLASWPLPFELKAMAPAISCTSQGRSTTEALQLYTAQSHWLAMTLALSVIAVFVVVLSLAAVVAVARDCARAGRLGRCIGFWGVLALSMSALAYHYLWTSWWSNGFLSPLMAILPPASCTPVYQGTAAMWLIGESVGSLTTTAMASVVVFANRPTADRLAARIQWLERLLYGGSLLFVIGMLVIHASLTWILANWIDVASSEAVAKAIGDLSVSLAMQAGVVYSGGLAIAFLPASAYFGWQARSLVPEEHRKTHRATLAWLEENDLHRSWQDNVKRILALLAPVLSTPVFNALAGAG
jgi:hypothetical protein